MMPMAVFADSNSHIVTINASGGGKVSKDGINWSDSVSVAVDDGDTLGDKVQYKPDEDYKLDSVIPSWKIVSVECGEFHTVLLDEDGNVWTAGQNDDGQLGRETSADSDSTFTQVTVGDSVKIKSIAAGFGHTVLLDEDGNVWTAGWNYFGQLGRTDDDNLTFTQVTVGDGVKIKSIAAGYANTVLLDEDGNVWTAGWDYYAQVGGEEADTNPNPNFTQVTVGDSVKIKFIAVGINHTVLLDENNNVWTAGRNDWGQLGRVTSSESDSTFAQVTVGNRVKIKSIAAGGLHTVLLDEDDNVWTAGLNYDGQLGRETSSGSDLTFMWVIIGDRVKIKSITAGVDHTVLLDENNNVWTVGRNLNGQLGRETSSFCDSTFTQVPSNPNLLADSITFDELITTPITSDAVWFVQFKDIEKPVITVDEKAEDNNENTQGNETKSPQTGDNSYMALWVALLFVSGGTLIVTTVISKKRKGSARSVLF